MTLRMVLPRVVHHGLLLDVVQGAVQAPGQQDLNQVLLGPDVAQLFGQVQLLRGVVLHPVWFGPPSCMPPVQDRRSSTWHGGKYANLTNKTNSTTIRKTKDM